MSFRFFTAAEQGIRSVALYTTVSIQLVFKCFTNAFNAPVEMLAPSATEGTWFASFVGSLFQYNLRPPGYAMNNVI